jgi:large exoprotein involved in heme utilization and adhesion
LFPSADSAITASSQLGVQGTVEVEGLDSEASKGLVEASSNLPDLTALIASGCEEYAGSEFIITGRGGLPPNPLETMSNINPIVEWASPEEGLQSSQRLEVASGTLKFQNQGLTASDRLVEATGWIRRPNGAIFLVANPEPTSRYDSWYNYPQCGGDFN